ncbi:NUDIX hydrolase [Chryseobacterium sp.]|uniref:NUDIX hydrolase n=1 Tax=Chryseobacterium sp. TaxID=1871047 RepID=UPI00388D8422
MIDTFNIRVYACVVQDNKVLTLYENYAGNALLKLPGGGLEFGESLKDCLRRELLEELNVKIEVGSHFYTQEDFLVSKFKNNEQLLTIYYLAKIVEGEKICIMDDGIYKVDWSSLESKENPFTLPIDRIVFNLLKEKFL